MSIFRDDRVNILFVGRIAPNKTNRKSDQGRFLL